MEEQKIDWKEIQKKMQEEDDQDFLKEVTKIRHRIKLLGVYGFDASQSIEIMKLIQLEGIEHSLNGESETVSESLARIMDVLEECQVEIYGNSAIAITGSINQI